MGRDSFICMGHDVQSSKVVRMILSKRLKMAIWVMPSTPQCCCCFCISVNAFHFHFPSNNSSAKMIRLMRNKPSAFHNCLIRFCFYLLKTRSSKLSREKSSTFSFFFLVHIYYMHERFVISIQSIQQSRQLK